MNYYSERKLSDKAAELIRFDTDSILQVAAAGRSTPPDTWLADPDEYERNGRIQRDSTSPRMLAYSRASQTLYATDGCNSCIRRLQHPIDALSSEDLDTFAADNEMRLELLERLVSLVKADR
jgi:hypothetical protein